MFGYLYCHFIISVKYHIMESLFISLSKDVPFVRITHFGDHQIWEVGEVQMKMCPIFFLFKHIVFICWYWFVWAMYRWPDLYVLEWLSYPCWLTFKKSWLPYGMPSHSHVWSGWWPAWGRVARPLGLGWFFANGPEALYFMKKNLLKLEGNLAHFPWDLVHFSVVQFIPQMYDPQKRDIVEKGNELAFQLYQILW